MVDSSVGVVDVYIPSMGISGTLMDIVEGSVCVIMVGEKFISIEADDVEVLQ